MDSESHSHTCATRDPLVLTDHGRFVPSSARLEEAVRLHPTTLPPLLSIWRRKHALTGITWEEVTSNEAAEHDLQRAPLPRAPS